MRHLAHNDHVSDPAGRDFAQSDAASKDEESYGDDLGLAKSRVSELTREQELASDRVIDADRVAERAVQAAASPPPRLEHRYAGEIPGTLGAEDVNTHEHDRAGLPD